MNTTASTTNYTKGNLSSAVNDSPDVPKTGDTVQITLEKQPMKTQIITTNPNGTNEMKTQTITVDPTTQGMINNVSTYRTVGPVDAQTFLSGKRGLHTPVVDSMLYSGLTLLCADTKTGASTLSMYLGGRITLGKPVFDTYPSQMGRVCYIEPDGDPVRLGDKIEALNKSADTEISMLMFDLVTESVPRGARFIAYLEKLITKRKMKAIFIDDHNSMLDPNQNQKKGELSIFTSLNDLGVRYNIAIVVNYPVNGSPFRSSSVVNDILKKAQNIIYLADFGSSHLSNVTSDRYSVLEFKGSDFSHFKIYYKWGSNQDIQFNIQKDRPPVEASDITLKKIELCHNYGMSQVDIASVLGVSQGYISQLTSGFESLDNSEYEDYDFPEIEEISEEFVSSDSPPALSNNGSDHGPNQDRLKEEEGANA